MKEHKRYIERGDLKGATHLEVSVYYAKGGVNCFSGGTIPRGYYLGVRPVSKRGGMVSFELFAGRKQLLFEISRCTDKQFGRAVKMAAVFEDQLIDAVVAENQAA